LCGEIEAGFIEINEAITFAREHQLGPALKVAFSLMRVY
jgi:hypothetical protein